MLYARIDYLRSVTVLGLLCSAPNRGKVELGTRCTDTAGAVSE
jgi:hypothetical protein